MLQGVARYPKTPTWFSLASKCRKNYATDADKCCKKNVKLFLLFLVGKESLTAPLYAILQVYKLFFSKELSILSILR